MERLHQTCTDSPDSLPLTADEAAGTLRRNKLTVRRAIECSLELLARLSNYRIYLSEREFARKLSGTFSTSDDGHSNEDESNINSNNSTDGIHLAINGAQGHESPMNSLSLLDNMQVPETRESTGDCGYIHPLADFEDGSGSKGCTPIQPSLNDAGNVYRVDQSHAFNRLASSQIQSRSKHNTRTLEPHKHHLTGTGPGPGRMPPLLIPPLNTQSSETDTIPRLSSIPPTARGGIAGFRKREGSASSGSLRPGSITSRTRGGFFAAAKSLFSHTNGGERHDESNTGYSLPGTMGSSEDSHDLQLHMALSAGDICKCHFRFQYEFQMNQGSCGCVIVPCMVANIIIGDLGGESGIDDLLVQDTGRLEYAICGEQMSTIEDALSLAHAGEVTITKSAWQYVNPDAYPLCEPRRNCFILKAIHTETASSIPLMRRVRNDKLLNAPVESNPHYFK